MKIGIAGFGKMGKDIFTLFFDTLNNTEFVVLELFGAEEKAAAIVKSLDKQLRRKKLTEEEYAAKKASFHFIEDASGFAGCDLVLEAVNEDLERKQTLFRQVAEAVSENCILATNTSSLEIAKIFEGIPHQERCLGMHFFYPVKLAEYIELNVLPETSPEVRQKLETLITEVGRKSVSFTGDYHIYLNQILSCMISHGVYLREYYHASVASLSKALSELFPMAGVFDLIDGIGLGLTASSQQSFRLVRTHALLKKGSEIMNGWLKEGCSPDTLCFLDFIKEHETYPDQECQDAALLMTALLVNEASRAMAESGCEPKRLLDAVYHTLGLAEPIPVLYQKYGAEQIQSALEQLYAKTGYACYESAGRDCWEQLNQNLD